ncbi:cytochrome P450 [Mycena vulgaris]|nr:cytochrome P450 [Mycena vulgaris]
MIIAAIPALLLTAVLARALFSAVQSIRTAFFSPLSSIPGPWYAAVSDLWLSTHLIRFKQTSTIHELFQIYGPVVRVGPKKVAFCNLAAMREVYSQQKFPKSDLYTNFKIDGVDQSLTLLDNASHSARRRILGSHYSRANITRLQPEIQKVTLKLIDSLEAVGGRLPVDCLDLLRNFMVDIVVFSTFGYDLGALQRWTINVPDHLSDAITDFPKMGILSSLFPTLVWKAASQFPHERWRRFTQTVPFLKEFVKARINEVQESGGEKASDASVLIHRMLEYHDPLTNEPVPLDTVVAEGVIAGSETSSTTLTYMLWELCCSPDVMQKLQTEIDGAMPDPRAIPDLPVLQALPYMNAFIQEAFRVYSVVPALLERVVPPGASFQLMEYSLPPGTVVGTQAWSVHKDPEVFPSPERFDPERWLGDKPDSALRAAHMMPFGLGTRACVGQQLAQANLRIALATIVRNFSIKADASTTKVSMAMRHGFATFPTAGEGKLIFIPRTD